MFTIQQAADQLGVTTKTLRQWEADGLLPFTVIRTRGGHRRYERDQVMQLKALLVSHAGQIPRARLDQPADVMARDYDSGERVGSTYRNVHHKAYYLDEDWWTARIAAREGRQKKVQQQFLEAVARQLPGPRIETGPPLLDNPLATGPADGPMRIDVIEAGMRRRIPVRYSRESKILRRSRRRSRSALRMRSIARVLMQIGALGAVISYAAGVDERTPQFLLLVLLAAILRGWSSVRLRRAAKLRSRYAGIGLALAGTASASNGDARLIPMWQSSDSRYSRSGPSAQDRARSSLVG